MAQRRSRLHQAVTAVMLPGAAIGMLAALPPTPAQAQTPGADLKILSPKAGDSLGSSAFSLNVQFSSRSTSPVTTAELWVDGVRWVRQELPEPQTKNVLQFAVDASTLSSGSHAIIVKVFCANGASSFTTLQVQAGDNAGVTEGSVYGPDLKFRTLTNGRRVMGSVPIDLDAAPRNGQNPWITIYVDKQFKTVKNYPPYTYNWDTSGVANGLHTIEATGYLESDKITTTRRISVFVDNPGGNTSIQKDVPDLNAKADVPSAALTVGAAQGAPLAKRVVGIVTGTTAAHSAFAFKPVGEPSIISTLSPAVEIGADAAPLDIVGVKAAASAASIVTPHLLAPGAAAQEMAEAKTVTRRVVSMRGGHRHTAAVKSFVPSPAVKSSAFIPVPTLDIVRTSDGLEVVGAPLASIAAPTAAFRPAAARLKAPFALPEMTAASAAFTTGGASTAVNQHSHTRFGRLSPFVPRAHHATMTMASSGGARVVIRPGALGLLNVPDGTGFQVAFNGSPIRFDVAPRVEQGMPLAPFRQIFEHTGGQVTWAEQTKVVHAINADREVTIAIGSDKARVNGESVSLDRAAFIDGGRTIVPLAFVGQALNVDVHYDATTGHIEINSK